MNKKETKQQKIDRLYEKLYIIQEKQNDILRFLINEKNRLLTEETNGVKLQYLMSLIKTITKIIKE